MALEPLIATVNVTNGEDVVTVTDQVLTPLNCRAGASVAIDGHATFVKALLSTTTFQITRNWPIATVTGGTAEIAPFTAEMASRVALSQELQNYNAALTLFEAYRRGFYCLFSAITDLSPPEPGHVAFDSADLSAVTAMVISDTDANNQPQSARVAQLKAGDELTIRTADTGNFVTVALTEAATRADPEDTFQTIANLTVVESEGDMATDDYVTVERTLAGITSGYLYVAYASDNSGSDFSLTPDPALTYVAFRVSATEIETPTAGDFTGLWQKYIGDPGDMSGANNLSELTDLTVARGNLGVRDVLTANRTYYVRNDLGAVTISNASPAVTTKAAHGLSAGDRAVFSNVANIGAVTMTIASPAVATRVAHGYAAGQPIKFETTGALPTGVTAGTTYYVIATGLTADDFQFSATLGGAAVNTSGSQSGTHRSMRASILPTGVTEGTAYYVLATGLTTDTFQFSATDGGASINTTGDQAGIVNVATGDDANDGLSAANALLTLSGAYTKAKQIDANGYTVSIQLADGTYVLGNFTFNTSIVGTGILYLKGNLTTLGNVVIENNGYHLFIQSNFFPLHVNGLAIRRNAATGSAFVVGAGCMLSYFKLRFEDVTRFCIENNGGSVIGDNLAVLEFASPGSSAAISGATGAKFQTTNQTMTLLDTSAFTRFYLLDGLSLYSAWNTTWAGSMSGPEYTLTNLSYLNRSAAGAIPGSSAGSADATCKVV